MLILFGSQSPYFTRIEIMRTPIMGPYSLHEGDGLALKTNVDVQVTREMRIAVSYTHLRAHET